MPFLLLAAAALALVLASKGGGDAAWGPKHLPTARDCDPGMPPEILAAVQNAIAYETSPQNLIGFANDIRPFYPRTAAILASRAQTLSHR